MSTAAVLAVGRGDGCVCLYSVEDGRMLHQFSAGAAITSLCWTEQAKAGEAEGVNNNASRYEEDWKTFLPPLPALDSRYVRTCSEVCTHNSSLGGALKLKFAPFCFCSS